MNKSQKDIDKVFKDSFGYTPLNERLKDIQREFFELMKWNDVQNLKEEAGDLICSLMQLHTESGWDVDENIMCTLNKIKGREQQYKSLGRKTKVAIFGGAFDPITEGHIQTAQFVLKTSGEFDEIWLMPAYESLSGKNMVSGEHRLAMCEIAAANDGRIKVFDFEIKHSMAGETYNLFKRMLLDEEMKAKYNFSMVIGIDNANIFDSWVNFTELERLVRFVVVPRKGIVRNDNVDWYLKEPHVFLNSETDIIEISSTKIRSELKDRHLAPGDERKPRGLDKNVYSYIEQHNLYEDN